MDILENVYIYIYKKQDKLIQEQTSEIRNNFLFDTAVTAHEQGYILPVSEQSSTLTTRSHNYAAECLLFCKYPINLYYIVNKKYTYILWGMQ
jgi:hypothetical protein